MIDTISSGSLPIVVLYFFISGLIGGALGFGFSAAGALSLIVFGPKDGYPLLICLSTLHVIFRGKLLGAHIFSISTFSSHGQWRFLFGGCLGAPVGLYLLLNSSPYAMQLALGVFIFICAIYFIFRPHRQEGTSGSDSFATHVGVGMLGGLAGGFSAFPNAPLIAWLKFNNATKETLLAIAQPFALVMQVICLIIATAFHPDIWNAQLAIALGFCTPAAAIGTWFGVLAFRHLSEQRHATLTSWALLACSGSILLAGSNSTAGIYGAIYTLDPAPPSVSAPPELSTPLTPISVRILFSFGSSELSPTALSTLDAAWLEAQQQYRAHPNSTLMVLITGKADSYGMPESKTASLAIAAARERTVRSYLHSLSLRDGIETHLATSRPEQAPANATAIIACRERDFPSSLDCLAQSRRVEIDLSLQMR